MGLVGLFGVKADFPDGAYDFEVVGVCGSRSPLERKVDRRVKLRGQGGRAWSYVGIISPAED